MTTSAVPSPPPLSDLLPVLTRWVDTNSASGNPAGLSRMADHLTEAMRSIPGCLERIPLDPYTDLNGESHQPGDALRLRFNEKAPLQVLFSGHMDTVYPADGPFQELKVLADGRLHGPGVTDMKGGLLIMIESVKAFLQGPLAEELGGEILITADEEVGSAASYRLLCEAARRARFGLVFESALPDGELVRRRKGTGTFKLTAHGRAAHTGRDFASGRNAALALSEVLLRCHELNTVVPDAIINVAGVAAPGPVNVVPAHAEAFLNVRLGKGETGPVVESAIDAIIEANRERWPDVTITRTGEFSRPPKRETPECEQLHELWNSSALALGLPAADQRDTGGSSDGNIFAAEGLPHLDGVGIRGGKIHSPEEFAIAESIPERIHIVTLFLQKLAHGKHR
jgi:glutamate carboxypeptidase